MSPVVYRFDPVGLDAWDRRACQPVPGTLVIKKHPGYGCPPQGTMGHCFVVPVDDTRGLGPVLVLEASLKRVDDVIAIHVKTENDTSGNPRRGYLILHDPTGVLDFVVEGYLGEAAVRHAGYSNCPIVTHIKVQPGEYRRLRTTHGDQRDRDT